MNDKSQIVENPLELLSLYPSGMYVFQDRPLFRYDYHGNYSKRILNVFSLDTKEQLHPSLAGPLSKIMCALKLDSKPIGEGDFAVLNVNKLENECTFEEILEEFEPVKAVFWMDSWEDDHTEIRYYETGKINRFDVLRVHSLPTVLKDPERKIACWEALKRFFAMG